jgi:hypothetical protein
MEIVGGYGQSSDEDGGYALVDAMNFERTRAGRIGNSTSKPVPTLS